MIQPWVATALLEAEQLLPAHSGLQDMCHLISALDGLAPPRRRAGRVTYCSTGGTRGVSHPASSTACGDNPEADGCQGPCSFASCSEV